jgi:O-antigen/teichoic acid export membrane protein
MLYQKPEKAAIRRKLLAAGAALVLALILYSPALLSGALPGNLTGWTFGEPPATFYGDWQAARAQILAGQLPLKLETGQPLLEASSAPLFYPGSLLYYVTGSLSVFLIGHLWWLATGLFWLALRLRLPRPYYIGLIPVLFAATFLRPDWLAATSWLPFVFLLAFWHKRYLAGILLTIPLSMLLLAVELPLSAALVLVSGGVWLWLATLRGKTLILLLAVIGGVFLAAPQLFPRLSYIYGWQPEQQGRFPLSLTLGAYAAFLALLSMFLMAIVIIWARLYTEDADSHPARRFLKNSATPLFAQLTGRVIDFGFAIFQLRFLGPEGSGEYVFATTSWLIFATICDFGLESIVTREMSRARDDEQTVNRLFITKLTLRLMFSAAALPLSLVWLSIFGLTGNLTSGSAWALIILMLGFYPSAVAGSITAVFRGHEKFEYLAAGQLVSSIVRVPLCIVFLLVGWGVVGLAVASILVNILQVVLLNILMRRFIFSPRYSLSAFDWSLGKTLLIASFPLMLNAIIINLLFKSDGLILQALRGNYELGLYNSAYKYIDALLIIPSTLTMALFPLFSIYGAGVKENLIRTYREGLRILLLIALPVSGGTLFVASDLIGVFGTEFLPGGAIALQILIWFLPFSYINGITQYVLIAIDKQRSLTVGIIIAAVGNIGLNFLLIPYFGFMASAALTIVTEWLLLIPFCWVLRRALGPGSLPIIGTAARPAAATALMMLALLGLFSLGIQNFFVTVIVGGAVYALGVVVFRAITQDDLRLLKKALRR